jgi:hypothetical protein
VFVGDLNSSALGFPFRYRATAAARSALTFNSAAWFLTLFWRSLCTFLLVQTSLGGRFVRLVDKPFSLILGEIVQRVYR